MKNILLSLKQIMLLLWIALTFPSCCMNTSASAQSDKLEPVSIQSVIGSAVDDGPWQLIELNQSIARSIDQKEVELEQLRSKLVLHAENSKVTEVFIDSHSTWEKLREMDSLIAARGEHGYSLARHLYLKEKLEITEKRINYLQNKFYLK